MLDPAVSSLFLARVLTVQVDGGGEECGGLNTTVIIRQLNLISFGAPNASTDLRKVKEYNGILEESYHTKSVCPRRLWARAMAADESEFFEADEKASRKASKSKSGGSRRKKKNKKKRD